MTLELQLDEVLKSLQNEELERFKWYLQRKELLNGANAVSTSELEGADRKKVVNVLMQTYGGTAKNISITILTKMNRNDLAHQLNDQV
ncbi:uncharacterized protein LOC121905496 isoform X2 [Scomber scombrus]